MPFYPSPLKTTATTSAEDRTRPPYGPSRISAPCCARRTAGPEVVTELVINHTLDQHPVVKRRARRRPLAERDFYDLERNRSEYLGTRIIFIDTETSNWTSIRSPSNTIGTAFSAISRTSTSTIPG